MRGEPIVHQGSRFRPSQPSGGRAAGDLQQSSPGPYPPPLRPLEEEIHVMQRSMQARRILGWRPAEGRSNDTDVVISCLGARPE